MDQTKRKVTGVEKYWMQIPIPHYAVIDIEQTFDGPRITIIFPHENITDMANILRQAHHHLEKNNGQSSS